MRHHTESDSRSESPSLGHSLYLLLAVFALAVVFLFANLEPLPRHPSSGFKPWEADPKPAEVKWEGKREGRLARDGN